MQSRIPALQQQQEAAVKALNHDPDVWSSNLGLGDRTAGLAVRVAQATVEPERIKERIKERQASPSHGLLLAHVRFALGAPEPLLMKASVSLILTGCYEFHAMIERVRSAVIIWPVFTPDFQQQMMSELASVGCRLIVRPWQN